MRARMPISRCSKCGHFFARVPNWRNHICPTEPFVIIDGTARKLALKSSRGKGG